MKNIDVYKIVFVLLASTFSFILIFVVIEMVLSKIPATPDNKEIRGQIIELVGGIGSTVNLILGYKLRDFIDNKNDNNLKP